MAWFERDHTGRELRTHERQFIAALGQLLNEIAAPQVDENETALTGEATHSLIVLIRYRALAGISIVVWLFEGGAEVTWAQVAALDCCHDSLDLGISVARFRFDTDRTDFDAILTCIRRQLSEPLTARVFDGDAADVLVQDHRGVLRKVGDVATASRVRGLLRHRECTQETTIRFTDSGAASGDRTVWC